MVGALAPSGCVSQSPSIRRFARSSALKIEAPGTVSPKPPRAAGFRADNPRSSIACRAVFGPLPGSTPARGARLPSGRDAALFPGRGVLPRDDAVFSTRRAAFAPRQ